MPPPEAAPGRGRITVEPSGVSFEVGPGETVFAAAERNGYRWPTVCGGTGSCRTCVMTVLEGEQCCSPVEAWEAEGLEEIGAFGRGVLQRLACQTRLTGPVRVRKPGVRLAS